MRINFSRLQKVTSDTEQ